MSMREFPMPEKSVAEAKDQTREQREKELKNAKEILMLMEKEIAGTETSAHAKFAQKKYPKGGQVVTPRDAMPSDDRAIFDQIVGFSRQLPALLRRQLGIQGDPEWDAFRYGRWEDYVARYLDKNSPDYIKPEHRRLEGESEFGDI